MRLTLLGTGTFVPSPHRASPGLLLETDDGSILFDPGPGTLRRLAEEGFDWLGLDQVGITHVHPDHTLDLNHLFFALRHAPHGPRTRPLTLFGPEGLREFVADLGRAYGRWVEPGEWERHFVELAPGAEHRACGVTITTEAMVHPVPALGFRITAADGTVLAYTGDTGYGAAVSALARDADLLVIECSSPDDRPLAGHLTPSGVARVARESGARELVLVHVYPGPEEERLADAVRAQCGARVRLGADGDRYQLEGRRASRSRRAT